MEYFHRLQQERRQYRPTEIFLQAITLEPERALESIVSSESELESIVSSESELDSVVSSESEL